MNSIAWEKHLPKRWGKLIPGHHMYRDGKMYTSKEYNSWRGMLTRCYYSKSVDYARYGGSGIRVCKRWVESFWNFLEDMGPRPEGTSINRKNHAKIYSPETCEWASHRIQVIERQKQKSNTSGYIGVSWHARDKTWRSYIRHQGKALHLGYYATKEKAALAYNTAAKKYHGPTAELNSVEAS